MRAYEARYIAAGGKKGEKWHRHAQAAEAGRNIGLAGATLGSAGLLAARTKSGRKLIAALPKVGHADQPDQAAPRQRERRARRRCLRRGQRALRRGRPAPSCVLPPQPGRRGRIGADPDARLHPDEARRTPMRLVPVEGVTKTVLELERQDPDAARELVRLSLYESLSDQVEKARPYLEPWVLTNMAETLAKSRSHLLREHVGKSIAGEQAPDATGPRPTCRRSTTTSARVSSAGPGSSSTASTRGTRAGASSAPTPESATSPGAASHPARPGKQPHPPPGPPLEAVRAHRRQDADDPDHPAPPHAQWAPGWGAGAPAHHPRRAAGPPGRARGRPGRDRARARP